MIRLHHCHQTRSMRTLWLLHELECDFDLVTYPFDKSLRSPQYLSLNPVGRVPALEIDNLVLWETGAITQVLCERFEEAGLGRSTADAERAEWLIWVHFAETVSQHAAALTQQHIALYDDAMRSPTVMRLEAMRLQKCYEALEGQLRDRVYILERGFSAADISVGQALYMAQRFAKIEPFKAVRTWMDKIVARPAFQASLPPKGAHLLYEKDFYPAWED